MGNHECQAWCIWKINIPEIRGDLNVKLLFKFLCIIYNTFSRNYILSASHCFLLPLNYNFSFFIPPFCGHMSVTSAPDGKFCKNTRSIITARN